MPWRAPSAAETSSAARREDAEKGERVMRVRRVPHLFVGRRRRRGPLAPGGGARHGGGAAGDGDDGDRGARLGGGRLRRDRHHRRGQLPAGVAVDPATGTAFVANYRGDTVSVIDEATDAVTATIGVGCMPHGVAVDPDTHTAFVANMATARCR